MEYKNMVLESAAISDAAYRKLPADVIQRANSAVDFVSAFDKLDGKNKLRILDTYEAYRSALTDSMVMLDKDVSRFTLPYMPTANARVLSTEKEFNSVLTANNLMRSWSVCKNDFLQPTWEHEKDMARDIVSNIVSKTGMTPMDVSRDEYVYRVDAIKSAEKTLNMSKGYTQMFVDTFNMLPLNSQRVLQAEYSANDDKFIDTLRSDGAVMPWYNMQSANQMAVGAVCTAFPDYLASDVMSDHSNTVSNMLEDIGLNDTRVKTPEAMFMRGRNAVDDFITAFEKQSNDIKASIITARQEYDTAFHFNAELGTLESKAEYERASTRYWDLMDRCGLADLQYRAIKRSNDISYADFQTQDGKAMQTEFFNEYESKLEQAGFVPFKDIMNSVHAKSLYVKTKDMDHTGHTDMLQSVVNNKQSQTKDRRLPEAYLNMEARRQFQSRGSFDPDFSDIEY